MSKILFFGTNITEATLLSVACDLLRADGRQTVGPRYDLKWPHPRRVGEFVEGYEVKLQGWSSAAIFRCDETGEMFADNYSDYHDERQIDAVTGLRIDGTGDVHPDVASGKKRVGDDGKWGNIRELDYLQAAYAAAAVMREADSKGFSVTKEQLDGCEGGMRLTVEVPEFLSV